MQDRLLDMLMQEDEITWQSIIYDLVKSEQMDPWDINVSLLSRKYIEVIKKLEEHNFFISGKVLLAAAILLKIKSNKLLVENIVEFDNQLFAKDEDLLDDVEEIQEEFKTPALLLKTPQARKRKVSLDDLMKALNKALQVEKRRTIRKEKERVIREIRLPEKKVDIGKLIKRIYEKILGFLKKKEEVSFSELVGSDKKEDKIMAFIPLLHLDNKNKIDLEQKEHFGEIYIKKIMTDK